MLREELVKSQRDQACAMVVSPESIFSVLVPLGRVLGDLCEYNPHSRQVAPKSHHKSGFSLPFALSSPGALCTKIGRRRKSAQNI